MPPILSELQEPEQGVDVDVRVEKHSSSKRSWGNAFQRGFYKAQHFNSK